MANNKYLVIILFILSNASFSQEIVKVLKNRKFIIKNDFYTKEQILYVYDKDKKKLKAKAKILICSQKKCRAKITKARKKFKLTKNLIILSSPIKKMATNKKKNDNKEDGNQEEEPSKENLNKGILASFGGPLLFDFRFAFRYSLENKLNVYGVYDLIQMNLGGVNLEGYGIGVGATYPIFGSIGAYLEVGSISTSIDFTSTNSEGPKLITNGVSYTNFGAEYLKQLGGKTWIGLCRLGYSLNGFESQYENDDGKGFTTPFAAGLLNFEIGLIYQF